MEALSVENTSTTYGANTTRRASLIFSLLYEFIQVQESIENSTKREQEENYLNSFWHGSFNVISQMQTESLSPTIH